MSFWCGRSHRWCISSSRWESTPSTPSKCPERISFKAELSMESGRRASRKSYNADEFPNRPSPPHTTSNKRTHSRWESLPIENSVRSMSPPHRPHSSPPVSPRSWWKKPRKALQKTATVLLTNVPFHRRNVYTIPLSSWKRFSNGNWVWGNTIFKSL